MTLRLDPRVGSGDLDAPLRQLGVEASVQPLPFGDVELIGRGPGERPVLIGVEIKALGDLLRCISDKRYVGHQLPGLLARFNLVYLLIEGVMTAAETRELLRLKRPGFMGSALPAEGRDAGTWMAAPFGTRPWRYEDVVSWLMTQENKSRERDDQAELRLAFTADRRGTAAWLAALHHWWTSKAYEEHRAHRGMHLKPLAADPLSAWDPEKQAELDRAYTATTLCTGIGEEKALAAARHFKSKRAMLNAPASEWEKVPGFGPKLARRVVEACVRGEAV
jgi:ERCC4-type nuclease